MSTHVDNLFIKNGNFVSCDRFINIVEQFINQFIESNIINIQFSNINWVYIFVNEIAILQSIRYKLFKIDVIKEIENDRLTHLIFKYRNKIIAHPEYTNLKDLFTDLELKVFNQLLACPVSMLHVYQYIHEDLYDRLIKEGEIKESAFHDTIVSFNQNNYNYIKNKLLSKLSIDQEEFLRRWDDAIKQLKLYKLNFPDSKLRRIKFMFYPVENV